jgi:hypothetical protein
MNNKELQEHVGSFVNIFNEKMSLYGLLKKTTTEGRYRLDILRGDGYYIFDKEDVISLSVQSSVLIALK